MTREEMVWFIQDFGKRYYEQPVDRSMYRMTWQYAKAKYINAGGLFAVQELSQAIAAMPDANPSNAEQLIDCFIAKMDGYSGYSRKPSVRLMFEGAMLAAQDILAFIGEEYEPWVNSIGERVWSRTKPQS